MIVVAVCPSLTGCSLFLVNHGQNLAELKTRDDVVRAFGEPATSDTMDERTVDEFTTIRKIAEPNKNIYLIMGYAGTFGLGEIIWFPHQVVIAARRSINGQHFKYTYDDAGNVIEVVWDGERQSPGIMAPHRFDCPN